MVKVLTNFFNSKSAPGVMLVLASIVAMLVANFGLYDWYQQWLNTNIAVKIAEFKIDKPLNLWINDGLMALFFLLIGLEIKRELYVGELKNPKNAILPLMAAVGGIAVPALIFLAFNFNHPETIQGWAIPTATDIAFAIGILTLVGARVPIGIIVFLTTLAVIDDLSAIIIIAIFYTHDLSLTSLYYALGGIGVLLLMNLLNVRNITLYLFVGVILWAFVIKSGVHATLAGVVVGLLMPMSEKPGAKNGLDEPPAIRLEHGLYPWVSFLILPLFAFANAGVSLQGMSWSMLTHPLFLGIVFGLFIGKQVGVFAFSWLTIRLGWGNLPAGSSWAMVYGAGLLAGIGFTMSLFIGTLAFDYDHPENMSIIRLSVLTASALSAVVGFMVLKWAIAKQDVNKNNAKA
jgi:NhaA family Na+:H+ antiporter